MSLMAHPGLDFIRDDVHASLLERGELTARVHLFPTLLDDMSRFEDMRARYTVRACRHPVSSSSSTACRASIPPG